jgi:hypothetical protein
LRDESFPGIAPVGKADLAAPVAERRAWDAVARHPAFAPTKLPHPGLEGFLSALPAGQQGVLFSTRRLLAKF